MSEIIEQAQPTPKESLSSILSLLSNEDSKLTFSILVPSLQQEITFKQLTTEQLKRLLKTIIDSPVYNTEFTLTINSVIKENCTDKTIDTGKFTIFDKLFIVFKTRIESISDTYIVKFTDEEIKDNNLTEKSLSINLVERLDNFAKQNNTFDNKDYSLNEFTITCSLPTLEIENKFEKELHKNIKTDINTPEELREIIGSTFVNEISKYITKLQIGEKVIDLSNYNFKERVKVIEKLPTNLINNAIKFIEKYKDLTGLLFKINTDIKDTTGNSVVLEKELPYDATFFNI
jgi:hypothetical protein